MVWFHLHAVCTTFRVGSFIVMDVCCLLLTSPQFCALLVALAAAMVVFGALAYTRRQEVKKKDHRTSDWEGRCSCFYKRVCFELSRLATVL